MSTCKKGVKKEKVSPTQKKLDDIYNQLRAFNAVHGSDFIIMRQADYDKDVAITHVQGFCKGEQRGADIYCIAMHEEFGFGPDRMKKLDDKYIEVYKEIRSLEEEDRKIGDEELTYSSSVLERRLQAACGKYYVPMPERGQNKIYYNGELVEVE